MKNLKFLVVLFLAVSVGVASCKKDDDNQISIVGKWKTTKEVTTEYINGQKQPEHVDTNFDSSDVMEFTSNGKATFGTGSFSMTLDYKVEGSTIKYTAGGIPVHEATIKSSSATELVLEEVDEDGSDKEVTVTTYTKM